MRIKAGDIVSPEHTPLVDAFLSCSLPILFVHPSTPEYPGNGGTCFAVRHRGRVVFLTAKHVVKDTDADVIFVPENFGRPRRVPIFTVASPAIADPEDWDWLDIAALIPAYEPTFATEHAVILDFEMAEMDDVRERCLFAVGGYPRDAIDYEKEQVHIERRRFAGYGFYRGPTSWKYCHSLRLKFIDGPIEIDGLSGAPVARIKIMNDGSWVPTLAGMVLRGGADDLHFVDVRVLKAILDNVVDTWPLNTP